MSRPKNFELSGCQDIGQAEDVILAGPIGTGKTMLAIALGPHSSPASSLSCTESFHKSERESPFSDNQLSKFLFGIRRIVN
jgi:hypothetical protein